VSGSFKAIIGSAVKFGLVTSKRDLITTTTLFKRIKHAYDKQEEIVFHREAFLTPPLFTQLCRKFRSKELPIQMLDVILIREFGVEEINAQGVAKAFVEGSRMVNILNEQNIITDIDDLSRRHKYRGKVMNTPPQTTQMESEIDDNQVLPSTSVRPNPSVTPLDFDAGLKNSHSTYDPTLSTPDNSNREKDNPITSLFGLFNDESYVITTTTAGTTGENKQVTNTESTSLASNKKNLAGENSGKTYPSFQQEKYFQIQISGPGVNTLLTITEKADLSIAYALLDKIKRQLHID